jgi:AmmeMemoRadiSam system protein B
MRFAIALILMLAAAPCALAHPTHHAAPKPPTLAQARAGMNIPSVSLDLRGQRDSVGFASTAAQMAKVWELSVLPPAPDSCGPLPPPGVVGALCPHDDYLYAGRVYRRVLPLVTARTVVLVGVFHQYRRFGEHDRLVFERYRAWRSPDGPVPVSDLREAMLAHMLPDDFVQSTAMHDSEHSLEAIVYWLKHARPDVEIVPILVPSLCPDRMSTLASRLAGAITAAMAARGLKLGRDVAVVISTDGVHYGADFEYVPYGDGGPDAHEKAVAKDRELLLGPLRGTLTPKKIRALYAEFVDPEDPDTYRLTWCGRFAVPFGLTLLEYLSRLPGSFTAWPVAYATSVSAPELPVREVGLGATAPATLQHFVSYPAVAFTHGAKRR